MQEEYHMPKSLQPGIASKPLYHAYTAKNQKRENIQNMNKTPSKILSVSYSNRPVISNFQRKIRQAIDVRYQKSKIKDYKYQLPNQLKSHKHSSLNSLVNSEKISFQVASQRSQDMDCMREFVHLKKERFVSIHQYHELKVHKKSESAKEKEYLRKRNLRNLKLKSIQTEDHFDDFSYQNNDEIVQQLNSLSPKHAKNHKEFNLDIQKHLNSNDVNNETCKRQSLTSRSFIHSDKLTHHQDNYFRENLQNNSCKNGINNIKDTFKLKNMNKFVQNKPKIQEEECLNVKDSQSRQQISGRTKNNNTKGRKYFVSRNLKLQRTNKTQPNEDSYKNLTLNRQYQKIPKTENKKVFSLKTIQTGLIEPSADKSTSTFQSGNKTAKNRRILQSNQSSFKKTFQISQKNHFNHSTSQQKWKLEEISFRFKPVNQQEKGFIQVKEEKGSIKIMEVDSFMSQKKENALKLGLSLEKVYSKLLSGRKAQKKQTANNFDTKKTITPKVEHKIYTAEAYLNERQIQRCEKSLSKNKRRRLRLKTESDQIGDSIYANETTSINKQSNRNSTSSRLESNGSRESLSQFRQKQRNQQVSSFRKKNRSERFSTIS